MIHIVTFTAYPGYFFTLIQIMIWLTETQEYALSTEQINAYMHGS